MSPLEIRELPLEVEPDALRMRWPGQGGAGGASSRRPALPTWSPSSNHSVSERPSDDVDLPTRMPWEPRLRRRACGCIDAQHGELLAQCNLLADLLRTPAT